MGQDNKYLKIIDQIRHTLTPHNKFHEILDEYEEIKLIVKQADMNHVLDKMNYQNMQIIEALTGIGIIGCNDSRQYFVTIWLTDTGKRFIQDYQEEIS